DLEGESRGISMSALHRTAAGSPLSGVRAAGWASLGVAGRVRRRARAQAKPVPPGAAAPLLPDNSPIRCLAADLTTEVRWLGTEFTPLQEDNLTAMLPALCFPGVILA